MSSMSAESPLQPSSASMADSPLHNRLLDRVLTFVGDHLNPILVKETRQALKSKQFVITFGLLLILAWGWSLLGVALIGPDVYYSANGPGMFIAYFVILAFPLLVIVPFSAFRSLTGEWEDNTYELMSITGLNPRQIISGKLGSSALQMIIYLSAISPCLAFTYMLRGIDFPTIMILMTYLVFGSLGLSLLGLLAGTLVAQKHWQVIMSVAVIIGLLLAFWLGCVLCVELIFWSGMPFGDSEFWIANGAMLTAYLSYFALLFFAAAAQLTFSSDNRTTRLRIVMVLQHILLTGWIAWALFEFGFEEEAIIAYLTVAGIHWYIMGACMTSEAVELSLRIKRNLPQSFLGRVFLTWFNPGPGTGYILAISGMLAAMVMSLAVLPLFDFNTTVARGFPAMGGTAFGSAYAVFFAYSFISLFYIVIFLGLGALILRLARRVSQVGVVLAVLIQILLLLTACGVPLVIQLMSPTLRDLDYSMLQLTNPFWTHSYMADTWRATQPETEAILWSLGIMAFLVFLANIGSVARELRHVRIMQPKRVAEEDAEKAALKTPPVSTKTNPWDD
jgi:hypothetical protein